MAQSYSSRWIENVSPPERSLRLPSRNHRCWRGAVALRRRLRLVWSTCWRMVERWLRSCVVAWPIGVCGSFEIGCWGAVDLISDLAKIDFGNFNFRSIGDYSVLSVSSSSPPFVDLNQTAATTAKFASNFDHRSWKPHFGQSAWSSLAGDLGLCCWSSSNRSWLVAAGASYSGGLIYFLDRVFHFLRPGSFFSWNLNCIQAESDSIVPCFDWNYHLSSSSVAAPYSSAASCPSSSQNCSSCWSWSLLVSRHLSFFFHNVAGLVVACEHNLVSCSHCLQRRDQFCWCCLAGTHCFLYIRRLNWSTFFEWWLKFLFFLVF